VACAWASVTHARAKTDIARSFNVNLVMFMVLLSP
jgi:hypothetical protein